MIKNYSYGILDNYYKLSLDDGKRRFTSKAVRIDNIEIVNGKIKRIEIFPKDGKVNLFFRKKKKKII